MSYGMDDEAGMSYVDRPTLSGEYFDFVHRRSNEIITAEMEHAITQIAEHRDAMDALVAALVEKNHLKGDEIDNILRSYISK
jgi:ATP-dependent Zn protease